MTPSWTRVPILTIDRMISCRRCSYCATSRAIFFNSSLKSQRWSYGSSQQNGDPFGRKCCVAQTLIQSNLPCTFSSSTAKRCCACGRHFGLPMLYDGWSSNCQNVVTGGNPFIISLKTNMPFSQNPAFHKIYVLSLLENQNLILFF